MSRRFSTTAYKYAFQRLHRSYPSLNLMVHVSQDQHALQVVLPGLRFDDINHTGQPNMVTVFDLMTHVETAGFGHEPSFLDYLSLRHQNLRTYVKACVMDISSEFYERTTPKAPLDINVKLTDIGKNTFTTVIELFCGGRLKPSIRIRSLHAVVNKQTKKSDNLPEWFFTRYSPLIKGQSNSKFVIEQVPKSDPTHKTTFTVPLSDTDHNERTRCAAYLRYFSDSSSVASRREMLKHVKSSFHHFHIKRLSMRYFGATNWGDSLTSEIWQSDNPLQIMCEVTHNEAPVWYGKMELFEKVFGLPDLEMTANNKK